MQLRGTFTLLVILLLAPLTIAGSYFSYTQARLRTHQLGQVMPLHESGIDMEMFKLLARGIANAPQSETQATPPPDFSPTASLTPLPLVVLGATPIPGSTEAAIEATVAPVASPQAAASIDPRRVTVLLMGIDQRQGETGQFRTDTMIVLSLDPVAKTGAMLSIPRDLWVSIPGGYGEARINSANYIGDIPANAYPGGGPALAKLTVEKTIGVPIDNYILVNFDAFTTLVESVGPIEICVKELIDDPKYPDGSYGFLPIRIEPGCQQMDATRLLQYARTRATPGGDFDRGVRQREVIMAVRDKVMSMGGATALLGQLTTLWTSVSENVRTDMALDEIIQLGLVAQEVTDVRSGAIGGGEVLKGTGPDGSDILIPIQTDILALVADLFRPPDAPASVAPVATQEPVVQVEITGTVEPGADLPLEVRQEGAIIGLLNGTTIRGRASALQKYVLEYNLDVGFVGNYSSTDMVESKIVFYEDHDATAALLSQVLAPLNNGIPVRIEYGEGRRPEGDVLVVIGADLVIPEPPAQ